MNDSTKISESEELKTDDEQLDAKESSPSPVISEAEVTEEESVTEVAETQPIVVKKVEMTPDDLQLPRLSFAKRCDLGAVRERNEDSCLVFTSDTGGHFKMPAFGLYIVADGMGGHADGHVASSIASRVAARHILENMYLPLLHNSTSANQVPIQEVLTDAAQAANTAVYEKDRDIDSGTTLTIALIFGRRLHVAHVGDSRLYLQAEDRFEAVTSDHSLVQRLQDVGQLTPEEATMYRYRNVLLRAVGQGEEVEIDTYMKLLPKKGRLLLCSDGLCGLVTDDIIREIMDQELPLQKTADTLYDAAMVAGGYDNITAVVVDFVL